MEMVDCSPGVVVVVVTSSMHCMKFLVDSDVDGVDDGLLLEDCPVHGDRLLLTTEGCGHWSACTRRHLLPPLLTTFVLVSCKGFFELAV